MNLEQFLALKNECDISPEDAQSLNNDLAKRSAIEVPVTHRTQVSDYLIAALNMNSVKHEISPKLESLLSELQNHT